MGARVHESVADSLHRLKRAAEDQARRAEDGVHARNTDARNADARKPTRGMRTRGVGTTGRCGARDSIGGIQSDPLALNGTLAT